MLFFKPNCKGVKERLKIIFKINGSRVKNGICFLINIKNTLPKDIMIKIYKKLQTGQNIHDGGDHVGLINFKYQFSVFIK